MDGAIPVIFQDGQNCTTVVVPIVDDEFWESDVFFGTTLNSTCNSTTITQNNAAVLIKDDDGMFVSDDVTFNYCSTICLLYPVTLLLQLGCGLSLLHTL